MIDKSCAIMASRCLEAWAIGKPFFLAASAKGQQIRAKTEVNTHPPCVAEGDGRVQYPVTGTETVAEAAESLLQPHDCMLLQATVGHSM